MSPDCGQEASYGEPCDVGHDLLAAAQRTRQEFSLGQC